MKMKKIIALTLTSALALGIGFVAIPKTTQSYETAEAAEQEILFYDDFSSHTSYAGMNTMWANQWFDGVGDGTLDQSCTEAEAQIATDGSHGNVLQMKTATTGQSFFYLTPRDENTGLPLVVTDFEVTFDFKILTSSTGCYSETAPWISILGRKTVQEASGDYVPADGRFNGTNSLMTSLRAGLRSGDTSSSPYFFPELMRVALSSMSGPPGGYAKNEDRSGPSVDDTTSTIYNTWHQYKCVVVENEVDLYLNDVHIGGYTIPSSEANDMYRVAGYLSFACCVWDGYIDNFTVKTASKVNTYNVTATTDPTAGGTVTGGGSFEEGASVTLTATTNTGYTFDGWYYDGTKVSSDETYSFTASADTKGAYTAKWNINKYTITATSSLPAAGEVSGGGEYDYGKSVSLVAAQPAAGYRFEGWYEGNNCVSTNYTYTFTVDSNRTLEARYAANNVTVSVAADNSAAGTVTGGGTVQYDESMTISATTNEGYEFLGWYDGAVQVSTAETYVFDAKETKTYTAKWQLKTYTVSVKSNLSSAGTVRGGGEFEHGSSVTVRATSKDAANKPFLGWFEVGGDVALSTELNYTFTITSDKALEARWDVGEVVTYTIGATADDSAAGSVEIAGADGAEATLENGSTVSLVATTNATYRFLGWYEGSELVSGNETYSFTVSADRTLVAKWERITYVITATAGTDGGSVSGAGTFIEGETVTLTATSIDDTWDFLGWYVGNGKVSDSATYTFTATADRTLNAKWERITYVITATAGMAGGEVTGANTYIKNESVTLTASDIPGYRFLGWFESNIKVSATATYTFTATADRSLVAKWELQPIVKSVDVTIGKSAKVSLAANASIISITKGGVELTDKSAVSYDQAAGVLEFTKYYVIKELGIGLSEFVVVTDTITYEITLNVSARTGLNKTITYGQKAIVQLDEDVYITSISLNGTPIPTDGVTYDNEGANPTYKLTFDKEYLKYLGVGTHVFTITPSDDITDSDLDNITITITVTEAEQTQQSSSGCGSVVGVSSAATLLGLAGVALIASKKRKNK